MFLGLLKPIKIKYREKYLKWKKNNVSKKLFICGCDTVLSNNKRNLTIAFTVLEEIYFSLQAQKRSTLHSGEATETQTKGIT